jgi:hypothetical protein
MSSGGSSRDPAPDGSRDSGRACYHSWYLEPEGTICHVVMDEAGVGKDAAGLRKSDETLMHRGHDLWLATLKWVAEAK